MRSASVRGDQRFIEPARGLEDRGAAIERRRESDLRLLLAEERDGFIHQRQRLRIVAHAETAPSTGGPRPPWLLSRLACRRSSAYERSRSSSAWSALPSRKFSQPRSRSTQPSASGRSRNRIDDAREFDGGGVDARRRWCSPARARCACGWRGRTCRPAGSSARPASACVMLWRLKPSCREASAAMACSAARRVGGMSARRRLMRGELRQRRCRIAECEFIERGEIAGLRADTGRMRYRRKMPPAPSRLAEQCRIVPVFCVESRCVVYAPTPAARSALFYRFRLLCSDTASKWYGVIAECLALGHIHGHQHSQLVPGPAPERVNVSC